MSDTQQSVAAPERKTSKATTPILIMVVVVALMLLVGGYILLSGGQPQRPGASTAASGQGGVQLQDQGASVVGGSNQFRRDQDIASAQQAEAGQGSYVADASNLQLQESMPANRVQVPRNQGISAASLSGPAPTTVAVSPPAPAPVNVEYRQAIMDAIGGTISRRVPTGPTVATFTRKSDLQALSSAQSNFEFQSQQIHLDAELQRIQASYDPNTTSGMDADGNVVVALQAGAIVTGYVENSLNTDAPGPVKVVVTEGPLKGSVMLGSMDRLQKRATVTLTQIIVPENKGGYHIPVNAILLDSVDLSIGAASEVNNHYFLRYGVRPALAAVIGAANALSTSRTRSTVVEGVIVQDNDIDNHDIARIGFGSAASAIYSDLSRFGNEPTVMVHQGEPVAILFLQPVTIRPGQPQVLATTGR